MKTIITAALLILATLAGNAQVQELEQENSVQKEQNSIQQTTPCVMESIMQSIYQNNARPIKHLACKRYQITYSLKSIYTHEGIFYLHTQIQNNSNIPFEVDFIHFRIVDKKIAKRTAIQEIDVHPIDSYNEIQLIQAQSTESTLFALPKLTIPHDKQLIIDLYEKHGERHQSITVPSFTLQQARTIAKLKIR